MIKKKRIGFGILFVLFIISATGCDLIGKEDDDGGDFKRVDAGLEMEFVANSPGDKYLIGGEAGAEEDIDIIIDLRNKGTFPEGDKFEEGTIYLGGFDNDIIVIGKLVNGIFVKDLREKSKSLFGRFLPAASTLNPMGGFDTVEFDGRIIGNKITIDEYNPTIMATACYKYATRASPTVCIDPSPYDERQEKVCRIGSQTLPSQGAPIAVTKIEQEAATNKIQFKIHIKNTGGADVLKPGEDTLNKCSPLGGGRLDRKDFDRVVLKKLQIGSVDLLGDGRCSPFADGTNNIIRLFNGEGFVICILDVRELGNVQSAYTTPLNIELGYNYRSTISKQIRIKKLETIGGPGPVAPSCGGLNQECCSGEKGDCDSGLFCDGDSACSSITPVSRGAVETSGPSVGVPECRAPNPSRTPCSASTPDSIRFEWFRVEGALTYEITWCPKEGGPCRSGRTERGFHQFTAERLEPDTNYDFSVMVFQDDGTGKCTATGLFTEPVTCKTYLPDCQAPEIEQAESTRCQSVTPSTIEFNWKAVEGFGNVKYGIEWRLQQENFVRDGPSYGYSYTTDTSKLVADLDPGKKYDFRVFLSESDIITCGDHPYSEIGSCETEGSSTQYLPATCGGLNQDCCDGESGSCDSGLFCAGDGSCSPIPTPTCPAPVISVNRCQQRGPDYIRFSFNAVTGAEKYVLEWCKTDVVEDEDYSVELSCDSKVVGPGTSNRADGLDSGSIYNFRVKVSQSDETTCKSPSVDSETVACATLGINNVTLNETNQYNLTINVTIPNGSVGSDITNVTEP